MLELSVAIVIVALLAAFLVNKHLNLQVQKFEKTDVLNSEAAEAALAAATSDLHKQFDSRINKCFETIQITKTELESLKMQLALKGK